MAVTTRPADAAAELADAAGAPPEAVLASPFFLLGEPGAIVERLQARRDELGVSYVAVFDRAADVLAPVVAALQGA